MGTVGWVVIVVSHTEGQRSFHWLGGGDGSLSLSLFLFNFKNHSQHRLLTLTHAALNPVIFYAAISNFLVP